MHFIELGLELHTKVDLLLMILRVLRVLFLKFEAHLTLILALFFQSLGILLQCVHVVLQRLFIVRLDLELLLILNSHSVERVLVLAADLLNEHLILGAVAVFEQNCIDLPKVSDDSKFFWRVVQRLVEQFVEAHRINEQPTVNSVDRFIRYTLFIQR